MTRNSKRVGILLTLAAFALVLLFTASSANAQLIISDKQLKVVKIDEVKYRIEITGVDQKPDVTTGYIYVDGNTKCTRNGRKFNWKKLKKGWIIRVKGGVRFDANVNAKEIWVIKTP